MPKETKLAGLCSTCNHAGDCSVVRGGGSPVLECEEFDIWRPPSDSPRASGAAGATSERTPATAKGLCGDCENRETCGFVRAEGGVWHCEEYR